MTTPGGSDAGLGIDGLEGLAHIDQESWVASEAARVGAGFPVAQGNFAFRFSEMLSGFANVIDAIFATADNSYISQLPIIQEQQNYITDLIDAVERMILQGQSVIYDSNNTHYISDGVTSIDFIILGSGGGGGGGESPLIGSVTYGGGGGGGGEVHFSVPRSVFGDSIEILVGAGGAGGSRGGSPGTGGSPSKIVTPDGEVAAGGGLGGASLGTQSWESAPRAAGGYGMIPGGSGGRGYISGDLDGTDSLSQYSLNGGGGGGGGAGSGSSNVGSGGRGGLTAGGSSSGQAGGSSDGVVATGGGGGSAGRDTNGGAGGFPAGGGGGAMRSSGTTGRDGGNGANGRVYVIERTT